MTSRVHAIIPQVALLAGLALVLIVAGYFWSTAPGPRIADHRTAMDRVRAVAGCWYFPPPQSSDSLWAPHLVRFDTVPSQLSYAELKLVLDTLTGKAFWALTQRAGRIVAFWEGYSSGFTELRLTVHGDSLSGRAYYTGDMGGVTRISVVAVRVTCPANLSALPNKRLKLAARVGY